MAEVDAGGGEGKGRHKKSTQKKISTRVDFTPMVDMNMLLITFFMFATSLSKPQTMEIAMPTRDDIPVEEKNEAAASKAITVLLADKGKIYYYFGKPNYEDYTSLKETDLSPTGLRAVLLDRNKEAAAQMRELRQKKAMRQVSDEEYKKQSTEIKGGNDLPIVMIKGMDDSEYKDLVDVLDEMAICSIGKYSIQDFTDTDQFLVDNLLSKGMLGQEAAPNK